MGVIDPDVWKEAANLMVKYGIVETLPESLDDTLALEFYEGPIVFEKCDTVVAVSDSDTTAYADIKSDAGTFVYDSKTGKYELVSSSAPHFHQFAKSVVMTLIAGVALLK